jgi:dolichol-phosphate mannosyltransferase
MLGIPVHDCTAGYRCYRRQVLESIDLDSIQSQGYAFQIELAYRVMQHGFKIVETPIVFMDRRVGKSKMSRKIVIEGFTYVIKARFSKQPKKSNPTPTNSTPKQSHEDSAQVELPSVAQK